MVKIIIICVIGVAMAILNVWLNTKIKKKEHKND